MGTAFSVPCSDNNHQVTIVGTHLENDFIDQIADRLEKKSATDKQIRNDWTKNSNDWTKKTNDWQKIANDKK